MDNIFLDLYQSRQIASAQAEASRASDKVAHFTDELQRLNARIDRLTLLNAALWELVAPRLELGDVELKAMALELDARDGKVDGRLGAAVRRCTRCGKTLMARQAKCQYCGTEHAPADPFARV